MMDQLKRIKWNWLRPVLRISDKNITYTHTSVHNEKVINSIHCKKINAQKHK